eukprot:m.57032 g.57032  ORF g.57032 m.57032 type:complete len:305 (+) comp9333_c0_seq4:504-1418(+)
MTEGWPRSSVETSNSFVKTLTKQSLRQLRGVLIQHCGCQMSCCRLSSRCSWRKKTRPSDLRWSAIGGATQRRRFSNGCCTNHLHFRLPAQPTSMASRWLAPSSSTRARTRLRGTLRVGERLSSRNGINSDPSGFDSKLHFDSMNTARILQTTVSFALRVRLRRSRVFVTGAPVGGGQFNLYQHVAKDTATGALATVAISLRSLRAGRSILKTSRFRIERGAVQAQRDRVMTICPWNLFHPSADYFDITTLAFNFALRIQHNDSDFDSDDSSSDDSSSEDDSTDYSDDSSVLDSEIDPDDSSDDD